MLNKSILISVIIFGVFALSFSLNLKVGIYDNYPLVYYSASSKQVEGIFVDLLSYIAKKNGWFLTYVYGTWDNLFNDLKSGKIDVLPDVAYLNQRLKFISYSNVTVATNWGVVCKKHSSVVVSSIFDLQGKKVALVDDVYYSFLKNETKSLGVDVRFYIVPSYEEALNSLEGGKVDLAVVNRYFALANLNKFPGIEKTSFIFSPTQLRFAFKKSMDNGTINSIDSYLKSMMSKRDSYYYKVVKKYFSQFHNKPIIPEWLYITLIIAIIFVLPLLIAVYTLRKIVKFNTKELLKKNDELLKRREELQELYSESQALNEELETSYAELDKYADTLNKIYSIMAKIGYQNINIETISEELLNLVMQSVEEADTGSVSIIEEGKWRFLATVGHDKDALNSLNLPAKYFIAPNDTTIIYDIQKENNSRMPKSLFEKFQKASVPINATLLSPIKIGDKVRGNLAVDIIEPNKFFSNNSLKIVKAISAIGSSFLTMNNYAKLQGELQKDVILTLIRILEIFDPYTEGHSEFVANYSAKLAQFIGLSKGKVRLIYWAGLVHDIGKVAVPKEVLNKPSRLTDEEFELIKQHPVVGHDLLITSEKLENVAKIVRHHHERYDGKGYPDGVKGDEIPFESRILTVVDSWHAMTSDRPYRKALSFEVAFNEIDKGKGSQFDPELASSFLKMISSEKQ